jgi:hypothetical protein
MVTAQVQAHSRRPTSFNPHRDLPRIACQPACGHEKLVNRWCSNCRLPGLPHVLTMLFLQLLAAGEYPDRRGFIVDANV